jgi:aspartate kinase
LTVGHALERARLHTTPAQFVTEHVRPAMPAQRLIIKFGGTSVGSGQAIATAAGIAADLRRAGHPVVVVTSAMSGVTDALLGGAAAAVRGERIHVRDLIETLRTKHHTAAGELGLSSAERTVVLDPIDGRLTEFAMLCDALAVLGDASPRALDAVSSLGERMSVHLLAGALRTIGTPAVPFLGWERPVCLSTQRRSSARTMPSNRPRLTRSRHAG